MGRPLVLAIAGDPGGANALLPVVRRLLLEQRVEVVCFAYRQAVPLWQGAGLPVQALAETLGDPELHHWLETSQPRFLLAATSMNGFQLEARCTRWARGANVPSLAVLDFWANYRERFLVPPGNHAELPDWIAVMDEQSRAAMAAVGMPSQRILVTGQPAFDGVQESGRTQDANARATLRSALGAGPKTRLILFLSQPIAAVCGSTAESPGYLGYTEQSVFHELHQAVVALRHRGDIRILFRPHPREDPGDAQRWIKPNAGDVDLALGGTTRELALASDLVVGMNTAFLIESCLLGCVTLSLQPGLRVPEALPLVQTGVLRAIYDPSRVQEALELHLFDEPTRENARARAQSMAPMGGATPPVVSAIYERLGFRSA